MTRVIVVDDEPDGCEILAEFLRIKGIEVVGIGHNGQEAFELYKKYRPDFTLMDYFMPEYDGIYGLKKIREFNNMAKVIILSASASHSDKNRMNELGAIETLSKPYDLDALVDNIHKYTKRKVLQTKRMM